MQDQNAIVLWPDTAESYLIFCELDTQWRVGASGIYALDYQGVEAALRLMGIPRRRWPALFDDIRTLEAGALKGLASK